MTRQYDDVNQNEFPSNPKALLRNPPWVEHKRVLTIQMDSEACDLILISIVDKQVINSREYLSVVIVNIFKKIIIHIDVAIRFSRAVCPNTAIFIILFKKHDSQKHFNN